MMKTKLFNYWTLLILVIISSCKEDSVTTDPETLPKDELATYHYRIPVVFHVLYKDQTDSKQYMKRGRAAEIITACNALYSNRSGNSTDINLEFVLATKDPNGKTLEEAGVKRTLWDTPTMDSETFMSSNDKSIINLLWDPDKYINIMLYTFTDKEVLGISHLPYTVSPYYLDGLNNLLFKPQQSNLSYPHCVSINNTYINEAQSREGYSYSTVDVVATLTHELGHYLGLHHAFNEKKINGELSTDVCENTDYCDDTPAYNRSEYQNFLDNYMPINGNKLGFADLPHLMKRRDCITHIESTPNNVMDYSISYVNRFTPEQRKRIRYVLNHSPFIPGPKVTRTRTRSVDGPQEFPIQMLK